MERSMFYGASQNTFEKARLLRENMTEAELLLWNKLNRRQLGERFKPQHPIDIFIADFYCHQLKLVIEVDGKIHMERKEYDIGRTAEINNYGITIIRFSNNEIINNIENVLQKIKEKMDALKKNPDELL
ncbi:MAG: endonuclease domain-containing protein [Bacteroidota bacterium]